jgi:FMN-dependent NADH-azoreductase
MATLLQIDSSPMGEASVSRQLTKEFVKRWLEANPKGNVIIRDLTAVAIPVVDAAWISANLTPKKSRTQKQNQILELSTELTNELLHADEYVVGVPMHNGGPSASFKLWVDQIVRFGETIVVTPSGPQGTLEAKRATFIIAAGRNYGPESENTSSNYLQPWLRTMFAFLGIKRMRFIIAEGAAAIRYGKIDLATFLKPHIQAVRALFAAQPA